MSSDELIAFILQRAPSAKVVKHPVCKTSAESLEARFQASGERVPGAKALLVKVEIRDQDNVFAVIVLPGFNKLDSKVVKQQLKELIPSFKAFRFATAEEMSQQAPGIQPGKMPPFGKPVFPAVTYTFVDQALLEFPRIGFNAADFERSIIMDTSEYMQIVEQDGVFLCSTSSESEL